MRGYTVTIKPSARRINPVASEWVGRRGRRRVFASKADAKTWADTISNEVTAVRIQNVAPNDPEEVDGYLVADPLRNYEEGNRDAMAMERIDSYRGNESAREDEVP